MKFIPILFSTPMVQAIIEGRKSMTRRVMKPQPYLEDGSTIWSYSKDSFGSLPPNKMTESPFGFKCPYGQVGDVLWVREKTCYVMIEHAHDLLVGFRERRQIIYGTDFHEDWMKYAKEKYLYKWEPSLFMPKAACRIFLKITDIRVERLQDISEEDAKREGVEIRYVLEKVGDEKPIEMYKDYSFNEDGYLVYYASFSFQTLWQSINGKESWEANLLVWVISFECIEKPIDFI